MWETYNKELQVDGRSFNVLVQDTGNKRKRKYFSLFIHTKKKKKKGGQDEFANMRSKVKNFYFDSLFNLKIEKIRAG